MLRREARDIPLCNGPAQHPLRGLVAVGVEHRVAAVEVEHLDARLGAQPPGAAVLFSSHQLDVVERLCDDLVIIAGGTIRAAGARDALRAQHSTRRFELVSAGDAGWLRSEPGVEVLDFDGGYAVFDVDSDETAQRVLRRAVANGDVASFAPQHPSLAQIFKEVIQ